MSNGPLPRIALFSMNIFGDGKSTGIPVLKDLFSGLAGQFHIVFYSFQESNQYLIPPGVELRKPISPRFPGRLRYLAIALRFLFDHRRNKYALIFSVSAYPTGLWAVRAGKLSGCPTVVQYIALEAVGLNDINAGNLTKPWLKKITEYVSAKADHLITVAPYQKEIAIKSLNIQRPIIDLPLRINPGKFNFAKKKFKQPIHFIQIGYYSRVKDQQTLFRTFAIISQKLDSTLTVIGEGFDNDEVLKLVDELGIKNRIQFVGIVPQEKLPDCFLNAQVLLHTARFETGCAVIQEAMASGLVVGGTQVGLLSDLGSDYAVIAPPQDPEVLAEKVLALLDDPNEIERITNNAYNWIREFDNDWSIKNYIKTLKEIMGKTQPGMANKLN